MNASKLIEAGGKSVEIKEFPGLFSCMMEHVVSNSSGKFEWSGPKISQSMWNEVLAFFRWTNDTSKSESQVRLFVHPERGWMAWAFPQRGDTGMTTSEISNKESAKQRAEVIPAGYLAFGTAHHHCSAGAFQSGTDSHDEKGVDGLHITVGNMDKEKHTIHSRLYLKGNKFEPNLEAFFDIGAEHEPHLAWMEGMNYNVESARNYIASQMMSVAPPKDHPFPDKWKENYIIPPKVVITYPYAGPVSSVPVQGGNGLGKTSGIGVPAAGSENGLGDEYSAFKAVERLNHWAVENGFSAEDVESVLDQLVRDPQQDVFVNVITELDANALTIEEAANACEILQEKSKLARAEGGGLD